MRPHKHVSQAYLSAFTELVGRIASSLHDTPAELLPVRMFVAGGAAMMFHLGARVSEDVDATFSRRLLLLNDLSVAYRDPDGAARVLYLDRNYNDTLGLLHESAFADALHLPLAGGHGKYLQVRVLSPLDLAVSKLSRFSDQDRQDIEALAHEKRISAKALRKRAEEALGGYIGNTASLQNTLEIACRLVLAAHPGKLG